MGPDLFVLFEEINDIMQCITPSSCQNSDRTLSIKIAEFIGFQSLNLCRTHTIGRYFVRHVLLKFFSEEPAHSLHTCIIYLIETIYNAVSYKI